MAFFSVSASCLSESSSFIVLGPPVSTDTNAKKKNIKFSVSINTKYVNIT